MGERVTCSLLRGAGEAVRQGPRLPRQLRPLRGVRQRSAVRARRRHRRLRCAGPSPSWRCSPRPPALPPPPARPTIATAPSARASPPPRSCWATTSSSAAGTGPRSGPPRSSTGAGATASGARGRRDFSLTVAGVQVGSEALHVESVDVTELDRGGLRVRMELSAPVALPGLTITRVAEAYPGVAGLPRPDGAGVAGAAGARARDPGRGGRRRGGADDPRLPRRRRLARARLAGAAAHGGRPAPGTWRESSHAGAGEPLRGPGEWLSTRDGSRSLFMVMERNDFPSSRLAYDGRVASAEVDWSRDVISFGPLEESIHVENPADGPARVRLVRPGEPLALARRLHRPRAGRRRRGVAVSPLPDRAPARPLRPRGHLQLERDRREPHLDRRQGRHGHRDGARGGGDRAAARRRDVHPRRRLAGPLGRLAARLAAVSGAALGRRSPARSSPRASRIRSSRPCARRSRRCGSGCG